MKGLGSVTFGLVHGAWHGAWCWEMTQHELRLRGYDSVAIDLPIDDPKSTFDDHAAIVADKLQTKERLILVGHSRGGNVIPRVVGRAAVERLVYVCGTFQASLPEYLANEGLYAPSCGLPGFKSGIMPVSNGLAAYDAAQAKEVFYHDCPPEVASWAISQLRLQSRAPEESMATWPDIGSDYVLCREDRVVNPEWSRFAARKWLGVDAIELAGGHSPFLSRPGVLAEALVSIVER